MYNTILTCLLDWVKCKAISMCNQVFIEATESKAMSTLLTRAIFLLLIQLAKGCVRLMHMCIT